jgi:hypothetical protein
MDGNQHRGTVRAAPTGKTISVTELEIVRFEHGRIVDLPQLADLASLMAQLSGE